MAEVAAAHGVWWPTATARSTQWVNLRRLLNARERLSDKSVTKMWDRISATDPTAQSLSAWIAKEELRTLLSTVRDGGDAHRLHRILAWCIDLQIPELLTLTRSSSLFLGSVRIGNMCILRLRESCLPMAASRSVCAWRGSLPVLNGHQRIRKFSEIMSIILSVSV